MYKYIFFVFIVFFVGCTSTSVNTNTNKEVVEENNYTSRNYTNISKDAIFEAAKKIFLLAGKDEFRIDSYRDHLVVSKTKMSHYPFYAITHDDVWDLHIEEKDNTSFAKLDLTRITDFEKDKPEYLSKSHHDFFWSRVDYLLGLSDEWEDCSTKIDLNDALCDGIDMNESKNATRKDLVKDILIVDRKRSKTLDEANDDILEEDIVFTLDDGKNDILDSSNNTNEQTNAEKTFDEDLDKVIEELDRKVNSNIDETLDRIDKDIENEEILEGN